MKNLRSTLIGFIVGGAFGAKLGAYLSLADNVSYQSWSLIELGFYFGASLGVFTSVAVLFVRSGVFDKGDLDISHGQLFTKGA